MSETLTQTIERLTQLIQEKAPNIDIAPGSVFNELIVGLESQIQNQVYNDIQAISAAQSISQALASLEDTYNPVIDQIASNYGVSRGQGSKSTGRVKVYVSTSKSYTIPKGVIFVQPSLGYSYVSSTVTSVDPGDLTTENGIYYFVIDVEANNLGARKNISNGTIFNLYNPSQILGFVRATAAGAFSDGLNVETDRELIARFRNGLGVKNLLSQNSITNKLTEEFAAFRDVYLADIKSSVNNRSTTSPSNIKIPGCVDAYVRNGINIPHNTFQTTDAVYTGSNKWLISLPKETSPGFYRVLTVRNAADAALAYLKFKTSYSFDEGSNQLNNAADARYSVYQNAVIEVDYREPEMSEVVTFEVTTLEPLQLSEIQDMFLDDANRIPCADYLVKGIVPCMVTMTLNLVRNNSSDVVDVAALQGDIFNYINGLSVGESLAISRIVDLCHNYNVKRVDLPVNITGRILAPYKSVTEVIDHDIVILGNDFLAIPDLPEHGVIRSNTSFYVSYFDDSGKQNINISIK